jgi:hypothetical protein
MTVRRAGGDAQDFGRLIAREPCEVAQLNQAGLDRITLGELGQGRVQGEQILVASKVCPGCSRARFCRASRRSSS